MSFIVKLIATFGFTGYFPVAPATFASAVFAAIYALVPGGEVIAHPIVCLITLVVSVPVSTQLEKQYGKDPGRVVIDEVVGMQVVLVGAADVGGWGILLAFFLFRVFDVVKPFPAGRSQRLPAGWGIVADDVLAGLYTRIVLVVLAVFFPNIGSFWL